ncbi:hypothetical protein [Bradyrhizobium elkanii]|uniref:hypothetical protein n=1 Tax=Bradyrhizobium elkanii TaxID=29448 RepID=UPI003D1D74B7
MPDLIETHGIYEAYRRLRKALEKIAKEPPANLDEPDMDWEVVQKMRAIARKALAQPNGSRG